MQGRRTTDDEVEKLLKPEATRMTVKVEAPAGTASTVIVTFAPRFVGLMLRYGSA